MSEPLVWEQLSDTAWRSENEVAVCLVVRSPVKSKYWSARVHFIMDTEKNPVDEWHALLEVSRATDNAAMRACQRLVSRLERSGDE